MPNSDTKISEPQSTTVEIVDEIECLKEENLEINKTNVVVTQQLTEEKQFIENIVNCISAPTFVIDRSHKVLFWNRSLEIMTGCSAGSMKGSDLHWSAFYKNKRATIADMVVDGLHDFNGIFEIAYPSKYAEGGMQSEGWYSFGGQSRYLLFEAAPIRDNNGNIIAAVETLEDITIRKQTEVALLDSELRQNKIINAALDAIIMLDPDGAISVWNDAAVRIFGYSAQEAIGENFHSLMVPKRYYTDHIKSFARFRNSGEGNAVGKIVELYGVRKNGEEFPVELALSSVYLHNQWHAIGILRDITQRKLDEAELSASKEALHEQHKQLNKVFRQMEKAKQEWETTLDCISDMVLMCDTYGKIKRCNHPISELTGLKYGEIIGKNWMSLLGEYDIQVVDFDGQRGHLFDQKQQRSFEVNVSPIKQPESPLQSGTVVSIHDTTVMDAMNSKLEKAYTDLQQSHLQVLQQEKMASIGQLAAGVAHEINNPMGFISSNLSSLGKYMEKISTFNAALLEAVQTQGDPETMVTLNELRKKMKIDFILGDISGLLAESQEGAERVRRIVQDLKSFSHVDETQCKRFSVNECLASTLNMARNEIKYVADVEQDYDPDLPLLSCYPQQLNQVFMNLLVNAAHAIEGHGIIRIKTLRESDDIVVRISDTGKGIAPENLTRVFEPFFTTKEVGKGTGLGLSISYDIIKKHGGAMNVESTVGVGTTFTIRLPLSHQFSAEEVVS